MRSTGATAYAPLHLCALAQAYAQLGRSDDARRSVDQGLATAEATNERWCEADLHRIAGEISRGSDPESAEACFERALAVARKQEARSWELRAALGLSSLWRDQGRHEQARTLLTPLYAWFGEGFDTLDLRRAKAILAELE